MRTHMRTHTRVRLRGRIPGGGREIDKPDNRAPLEANTREVPYGREAPPRSRPPAVRP